MSDSQNHHDITHLLTPFFDRQLIIPFLEFLSGKEIYKEEHILNAKIELLRGTKMADALVEIYETMGETAPDDLLARREAIVADYRLREQEITNIVGAIERIQQDEGKIDRPILLLMNEEKTFIYDGLFQTPLSNYSIFPADFFFVMT